MLYDVVALGELLIDFTPVHSAQHEEILYKRNPGGAPANVLAAVSKLGGKGAFIGKVGRDSFGYYLQEVLDDISVETQGLKLCDAHGTTLAFVHLNEKGDRSFTFYRDPGADTQLCKEEVEYSFIDHAHIFHFGSLSMTAEPAREATLAAVTYAKEKGKIISYDPNWRPLLWRNDTEAYNGMQAGLQFADIVKLSEEELVFLTGQRDLEQGGRALLQMGVKLVLVTLGPKGCYYVHKSGVGHIATYDTKVIDTTGAGDAFLGGVLYQITRGRYNVEEMNRQDLEHILDFANAVGALCTTKSGAIPAMPLWEEVEQCRKSVPKLLVV